MTLPLISAATAGCIAILQMILMITVGLFRTRAGIFVGQGEDPNMIRLMRRHGNLSENGALFLVALTLLEVIGAAQTLVAALAAIFLVARILHAIGFSSLTGSHGEPGSRAFVAARALGAFGTFACGLIVGSALLFESMHLGGWL
ncbi:MAG: MAPEG family protein [Pseudomonadota bacterium]